MPDEKQTPAGGESAPKNIPLPPPPPSPLSIENVNNAQAPGMTHVSEGDNTPRSSINEIYSGDSSGGSSKE